MDVVSILKNNPLTVWISTLFILTIVLLSIKKDVDTYLWFSQIMDFLWTVTLFTIILLNKDFVNSLPLLSRIPNEQVRIAVSLVLALLAVKVIVVFVARQVNVEFYEDEEKYEDEKVKEGFGCYRGGWCGSGKCITGKKFIGWCL